jgi:hypothetical protein
VFTVHLAGVRGFGRRIGRRIGAKEIQLVVGLGRGFCARQFFEDGIQAHLRVVDLRRESVAFRLQRVTIFAHLREFDLHGGEVGTQLVELFFECAAGLVMALADLDQPMFCESDSSSLSMCCVL